MRKFLVGLLVLVAILAGAFWYFSSPDIPRSVLEAKYGAPASEFIELQYTPPHTVQTDSMGAPRSSIEPAHVHFRERGAKNAPVLILLHGSNASFLTWE